MMCMVLYKNWFEELCIPNIQSSIKIIDWETSHNGLKDVRHITDF